MEQPSGTTTVTGREKRTPRDGSAASVASTRAKWTPAGSPSGFSLTVNDWLPRSRAESSTIDAGAVTHGALAFSATSISVPSNSSSSSSERPASGKS